MCRVKYFICPMSKNVVDSVLELGSDLIGLLPSRRQIDFNGGYVNHWNTKSFVGYVNNSSRVIIERDHAGINQGEGDEYESYREDSNYMNIIHIDPWKKFDGLEDGLKETVKNINFISELNRKVKFEVGTEQTIRKFDVYEFNYLLSELKIELPKLIFGNIIYACIQSGVSLDVVNQKNTGDFNLYKLRTMIKVCRNFDILSKEHNGDYLSPNDIRLRFSEGLNTINIGPEIVQLETETYLDHMNKEEIDDFYKICLESQTWKKWVDEDFDTSNKEKLIMVCGHYNFSKYNLPRINDVVKDRIKNKLQQLLTYV